MKTFKIILPDDFTPGGCLSYPSSPKCPFAARGCWVHNPKNCPLADLKPIEEKSDAEKK